jgi:hypothetical protein
MRSRVDLYQSFSGPEQASWIADSSHSIDHQMCGGFEFDLFQKIDSQRQTNDRPWGLVSWKFEHKTQMAVESFHMEAARIIEGGADCVFVNPMIGSHAICRNVWHHGEWTGHRGILSIEEFLVSRNFIDVSSKFMRSDKFALCNFFIATPRFWRHYFEYVRSVISCLESEANHGSEVGRVYKSNAGYVKDSTLSMRPFIIERLFSSFICASNLCVVPIAPIYQRYTQKFGVLLGSTLSKLASLKEEIPFGAVEIDRNIAWQSFVEKFLRTGVVDLVVRLDDPPVVLGNYAKELAYTG